MSSAMGSISQGRLRSTKHEGWLKICLDYSSPFPAPSGSLLLLSLLSLLSCYGLLPPLLRYEPLVCFPHIRLLGGCCPSLLLTSKTQGVKPSLLTRDIMELQDSDHDHEQRQQQERYVYGRSFMARSFGRVMDGLRRFEIAINTSTFGRVFRLDGSGHVSASLSI